MTIENRNSHEIPQFLKDAFDALRSPEEDNEVNGTFVLTIVEVDREEHYAIAAIYETEQGEVMIPLFISLPPDKEVSVLLASGDRVVGQEIASEGDCH